MVVMEIFTLLRDNGKKGIMCRGAIEKSIFSPSLVLFICLHCFGWKSRVLEIRAVEVCLLSCLMDVDGTRGARRAKKYIWENLNMLQIWMTRRRCFLSTSLPPNELASVLRDWLPKLDTVPVCVCSTWINEPHSKQRRFDQ